MLQDFTTAPLNIQGAVPRPAIFRNHAPRPPDPREARRFESPSLSRDLVFGRIGLRRIGQAVFLHRAFAYAFCDGVPCIGMTCQPRVSVQQPGCQGGDQDYSGNRDTNHRQHRANEVPDKSCYRRNRAGQLRWPRTLANVARLCDGPISEHRPKSVSAADQQRPTAMVARCRASR